MQRLPPLPHLPSHGAKTRCTKSGSSAMAAKAARNQQSPKAPCLISDGAMSSEKILWGSWLKMVDPENLMTSKAMTELPNEACDGLWPWWLAAALWGRAPSAPGPA